MTVPTDSETVVVGDPADPLDDLRRLPPPDGGDDRHVGMIVLTGQGSDAFCSGGDQRIQLAGDATLPFSTTEEGPGGRNAFVEHRPPDFSGSPRRP